MTTNLKMGTLQKQTGEHEDNEEEGDTVATSFKPSVWLDDRWKMVGMMQSMCAAGMHRN